MSYLMDEANETDNLELDYSEMTAAAVTGFKGASNWQGAEFE